MQSKIKKVEKYLLQLSGFKIVDLCRAINPHKKIKIIGIRPGEKLHEELISKFEANDTIDLGNYYVILPQKYYDKFNYDLRKAKFVPIFIIVVVKNYLNISDLLKL